MIRKALLLGILGLAPLLVATHPSTYHRIVVSAQNFQRYFQDLNGEGRSLTPVERFVFSVILASNNPTGAAN